MHLVVIQSDFIHEYNHLNFISPFGQIDFQSGLFV